MEISGKFEKAERATMHIFERGAGQATPNNRIPTRSVQLHSLRWCIVDDTSYGIRVVPPRYNPLLYR